MKPMHVLQCAVPRAPANAFFAGPPTAAPRAISSSPQQASRLIHAVNDFAMENPMPRTQDIEPLEPRQLLSGGSTGFVTQTNLVSDGFVPAAVNDPHLKNPWGVAFAPGGPLWVSDNNGNVATVYDGNGAIQNVVVNVPGGG